MAAHVPDNIDEPLDIAPATADRLRLVGLALGVIALVAALIVSLVFGFGGLRRFMLSYLTGFVFVLTIALGALFFVLLQHATKAGWSVNVRRVPELMTRLFVPLAVLSLPILLVTLFIPGEFKENAQTHEIESLPTLYPWAGYAHHDEEHGGEGEGEYVDDYAPEVGQDPGVEGLQERVEDGTPNVLEEEVVDGHILTENGITIERARHHLHIDEITEKKTAYLNRPFFVARVAIYFFAWWALSQYFWRRSTEQDSTGEPRLTKEMTGRSYVGFLIYAITLTFAAFDLVMSLDPHFFSTIFGGYLFAGGVVSFFAATILAYQVLRMRGYLRQSVTVEHYHDLGKFLFAFVFFWGYIAFSQFMLIWYANIPETTYWFGVRGATSVPENMYLGDWPSDPAAPAGFGYWTIISMTLLFGHLLIPFAGLLSRHVKRNLTFLGFWAGWMLVMHYVDIYWLIMPEQLIGGWGLLPVVEVLCLIGFVAIAIGWVAGEAKVVKLRPVRDPRAVESLAFHNL